MPVYLDGRGHPPAEAAHAWGGYSTGTCGKDGQGVPVGDGVPTLRVQALTIGGTAA